MNLLEIARVDNPNVNPYSEDGLQQIADSVFGSEIKQMITDGGDFVDNTFMYSFLYHYLFNEIGFDTLAMWRLRFVDKWVTNKQLIDTLKRIQDEAFLGGSNGTSGTDYYSTIDGTTTPDLTTTNSAKSSGSSTGSTISSSENSGRSSSSEASDSESKFTKTGKINNNYGAVDTSNKIGKVTGTNKTYISDTPQGSLSNVDDGKYISNAQVQKAFDEGRTDSTNTKARTDSTDFQNYSETTTVKKDPVKNKIDASTSGKIAGKSDSAGTISNENNSTSKTTGSTTSQSRTDGSSSSYFSNFDATQMKKMESRYSFIWKFFDDLFFGLLGSFDVF